MSDSPYCLPYSSCDVNFENLVFWSINNSPIDIFFYSHDLSTGYCIDIVGRNSLLVTDGS